MNNYLYTPTSLLVLLCYAIIFSIAFIFLSFLPGHSILKFIINADMFLTLGMVNWIFYRMFLERIMREANINEEDQKEDRRSDAENYGRIFHFIFGLIISVLTLIALIEYSKLGLSTIERVAMFIGSIVYILSALFAGVLAYFLSKNYESVEDVKRRSIIRMLIVVSAGFLLLVVLICILAF